MNSWKYILRLKESVKFIIIVILSVVMGCGESTKDKDNKWVFIEDGACYMETQRAKRDFDKGILVYTFYNMDEYAHNDRLKAALLKYNIDYMPLGENCLADSNCYGKYMYSKIVEKYSVNFIDSLKREIYSSSEDTFITNN